MTRDEARDAIIEILYEEAADSPRYMGNGGPEVVADMILNRLGHRVSYDRIQRPETSCWVPIEITNDGDRVMTIHDPFRSYEAAEAFEAACDRDSIFEFYQNHIAGDIAEDGIVYALIEYDRANDCLTVDSIYINRAEAENGMAKEKAEIAAEGLTGHYDFHIQQMKLQA
ncbi:hypothetical protein HOU02_gp473 [Caulobacter phage CcrBL9]|uniref:Uncharacterized protein n=1 Tax=Caulobacter phage CcrBL9 TaxID=2283270 RepID=A0A385EEG9_9CAUD|nr:hypothetical protein HOU02_gp473 [Caulobacter phage CcrBL9]AXQ69252.1 hypothetical protein CcrBL9_gp228c [Caulobacter phage CcrBL9]